MGTLSESPSEKTIIRSPGYSLIQYLRVSFGLSPSVPI